MMALQPLEVLGTLKAVGLTVSLTPGFGLMVSPVRQLTDDLRDLIRTHTSLPWSTCSSARPQSRLSPSSRCSRSASPSWSTKLAWLPICPW